MSSVHFIPSSFSNLTSERDCQALKDFQAAVGSGKRSNQQKIQIANALQLMKQVPGEIDLHLVAEPLYSIGNMEVSKWHVTQQDSCDFFSSLFNPFYL